MMFTEEDIARFRQQIADYNLQAPYVLGQLSDFELTKICNGWGPDSWPEIIRKALTALAGEYAVIHVPHDVRYEFHVGTQKSADCEFWTNGKKIWRKRWGWRGYFYKQAWIELIALRAAYRALCAFGSKAWEEVQNDGAS